MAGNHYDQTLAVERIVRGSIIGLVRWCEMVLGKAVKQAPIETGALRGSGTVEEPDEALVMAILAERGGIVWARIVFPLVYAAYQHEGMRADGSYVITEHPKGGKTHYLEDPVKDATGLLGPAQAAGIRQELHGR